MGQVLAPECTMGQVMAPGRGHGSVRVQPHLDWPPTHCPCSAMYVEQTRQQLLRKVLFPVRPPHSSQGAAVGWGAAPWA